MLITNATGIKLKLVYYRDISEDDQEVVKEIELNPSCAEFVEPDESFQIELKDG